MLYGSCSLKSSFLLLSCHIFSAFTEWRKNATVTKTFSAFPSYGFVTRFTNVLIVMSFFFLWTCVRSLVEFITSKINLNGTILALCKYSTSLTCFEQTLSRRRWVLFLLKNMAYIKINFKKSFHVHLLLVHVKCLEFLKLNPFDMLRKLKKRMVLNNKECARISKKIN